MFQFYVEIHGHRRTINQRAKLIRAAIDPIFAFGFGIFFYGLLLLVVDCLFELATNAVFWRLGSDRNGSLCANILFR